MFGWQVYLSGEIHTDWRDEIARGVEATGLDVTLTGPVTHHEASDDCGVVIMGAEPNKFWHDHKTRPFFWPMRISSWNQISTGRSGCSACNAARREAKFF